MVALRVGKQHKYDILDYESLRGPYIWNLNQQDLQPCITEALEVISIEYYMEWYKNITRRRRIHRHQLEHDEQYEPRAYFNQIVVVNLATFLYVIFS